MQCAYTLDQRPTVTLQWFKTDRTNHVLIWTAVSTGHTAAESPLLHINPASAYPLSKGHAIVINNFHPDNQDYYFCTISSPSLGVNNHVSSNLIQVAETGISI